MNQLHEFTAIETALSNEAGRSCLSKKLSPLRLSQEFENRPNKKVPIQFEIKTCPIKIVLKGERHINLQNSNHKNLLSTKSSSKIFLNPQLKKTHKLSKSPEKKKLNDRNWQKKPRSRDKKSQGRNKFNSILVNSNLKLSKFKINEKEKTESDFSAGKKVQKNEVFVFKSKKMIVCEDLSGSDASEREQTPCKILLAGNQSQNILALDQNIICKENSLRINMEIILETKSQNIK